MNRKPCIALLVLLALIANRALSAEPSFSYSIQPESVTRVSVTDGFWKSRLDAHYAVTMPHVLDQCERTGRLNNLRIAAGQKEGDFEGIYFNDSDVYKIIEGLAYSSPGPITDAQKTQLAELVETIKKAQMDDGYLYTFYQLNDELHRRWDEFSMHELYNAGHLIEAGVAHFEATGKRDLLEVAVKFADLLDATYGPEKRLTPPEHQVMELALVKLYGATGEARYLKLAKFFLEQRGNSNRGAMGNWYEQDHRPLLDQEEAVGHAVRAVYGYAGMTDIAAITGDPQYVRAVDKLWDNVVGKKMAISGGIGGGLWEAFDKEYYLPNRTAYNETCGSVAMVFWSQRMFQLHGDAKYIDVLERALYNGVLTGVSIRGDSFFYPNPLETGGGQRSPWFDCACCPSNIARMIPSIAQYLYAKKDDKLYVNLYGSSEVNSDFGKGPVAISQQTSYPWDGDIKIGVNPEQSQQFSLLLRIPGWATNAPVPTDLYEYIDEDTTTVSLQINGLSTPCKTERGYIEINRVWDAGDTIELKLPMPVRRTIAHPSVKDDRGLVAIERGPLLYCVEGVDNLDAGQRMQNLLITDDADLSTEWCEDLLGGVVKISASGKLVGRGEDGVSVTRKPITIAAIPYFARANRESSPMSVWLLRDESRAILPPAPSLASQSKASASSGEGNFAALSDQIEPARSADASRGMFNFRDKIGTTEWVQYDFPSSQSISMSEVYWYDRFGTLERKPKSWRLLYRQGDQWLPVKNEQPYNVEIDKYNRVNFEAVETDALRMEVTMQDAFKDPYLALPETEPSAFTTSILEWIAK